MRATVRVASEKKWQELIRQQQQSKLSVSAFCRQHGFSDHHAIFEAVHGTAPDIAGKGLANPTALMQSAALMLAHIGERDAAKRLKSAVASVYAEGKHLTGDVGGHAGTAEFTDAVVRHIGG